MEKIKPHFTLKKGNQQEWHETILELTKFMNDPLIGKWKRKMKGIKSNEIRDMMKASKNGNPPQRLFNHILKQRKAL